MRKTIKHNHVRNVPFHSLEQGEELHITSFTTFSQGSSRPPPTFPVLRSKLKITWVREIKWICIFDFHMATIICITLAWRWWMVDCAVGVSCLVLDDQSPVNDVFSDELNVQPCLHSEAYSTDKKERGKVGMVRGWIDCTSHEAPDI